MCFVSTSCRPARTARQIHEAIFPRWCFRNPPVMIIFTQWPLRNRPFSIKGSCRTNSTRPLSIKDPFLLLAMFRRAVSFLASPMDLAPNTRETDATPVTLGKRNITRLVLERGIASPSATVLTLSHPSRTLPHRLANAERVFSRLFRVS